MDRLSSGVVGDRVRGREPLPPRPTRRYGVSEVEKFGRDSALGRDSSGKEGKCVVAAKVYSNRKAQLSRKNVLTLLRS